jgi:hypothetical protein
MLTNMTSKQKFILSQKYFFAIMLNIETFLNCCQKQGGVKCPDCYAPVLGYQSELYFYFYYMNLILLFGYHQTSLSTAPHTKTLYYKRGFFNNIYFLFFRKIALPMVIFMLLFVVLLS